MGVIEPLLMTGYAAGEIALDAKANEQAKYPSGGGVNGLFSSDPGKSGVDPAVQIDSTQSLAYFQQAAAMFNASANQGMQYYENAIKDAHTYIQNSTNTANKILEPYGTTGSAAMNQFMTMLGINGLSPTRFTGQSLGVLSNEVYSNNNKIGDQLDDIGKLVAKAELIKDPTQRAIARQNIMDQLQATQQSYNQYLDTRYQDQVAKYGPKPTNALAAYLDIDDKYYESLVKKADKVANTPLPAGQVRHEAEAMLDSWPLQHMIEKQGIENDLWWQTQGGAPGLQEGLAATQRLREVKKYWQEGFDEFTNQYNTSKKSFNDQIHNIMRQYDQNYLDNPTYFGKTAEEIDQTLGIMPGYTEAKSRLAVNSKPLTLEELKNTPGYEFMYDQGQRAVLSAGAAGGMLSSGNTMAAAARYAEGLAQQVYQYENDSRTKNYQFDQQVVSNDYSNYMQSLLAPYQIGYNATAATANNIMTQGSLDAQLSQAQGQAGLQTNLAIGQMTFKSLEDMGNTYNSNQRANMDAQNQMILAHRQSQSSATNAAIGQSGNLANAANQSNNQAQMVQGFNGGGGGSGWPTFSGGRWSIG